MDPNQEQNLDTTPTPAVTPEPAVNPVAPEPAIAPSTTTKHTGVAALILAITSLVLGIVWPISLPLAIIAIIMGIMSLAKKRESKKLNLVAVIISGITILLFPLWLLFSIAMYGGILEAAKEYNQEQTSTNTSISPDAIPLSTRTTPSFDSVWGFPANVEGWTLTKANQNGVNELMKGDRLAYFTSYQTTLDGSGVDTTKSERESTEQYIDVFLGITRDQGATVTKLSNSEVEVGSTEGKSAVFIKQNYTYQFPNRDLIKGVLVARVTGSNNALSYEYKSPDATFSNADMNMLFDKIKLVKGLEAAN